MLDISVIIVNWNSGHVLAECLRRITRELRTVSGECIVIDNNSADDDLGFLSREFPQFPLIVNSRNLGFARAVNIGIRRSSGRYLLLLNPDAFLSEGSLRPLVSLLDGAPEIGIVGPSIVNPDGTLQGSARAFPRLTTALFGRTSFLSRHFPHNPFTHRQVTVHSTRRDRPQPVDWVSGACLVVRREVLEEVGGLDERYFLYWEDADLCWRARQRGWQVVYEPRVSAMHLIGESSKHAPVRSLISFHRSAYRFYRTHITRTTWHPLNIVAVTGLSIRTALVLGWRALCQSVKAVGQSQTPVRAGRNL